MPARAESAATSSESCAARRSASRGRASCALQRLHGFTLGLADGGAGGVGEGEVGGDVAAGERHRVDAGGAQARGDAGIRDEVGPGLVDRRGGGGAGGGRRAEVLAGERLRSAETIQKVAAAGVEGGEVLGLAFGLGGGGLLALQQGREADQQAEDQEQHDLGHGQAEHEAAPIGDAVARDAGHQRTSTGGTGVTSADAEGPRGGGGA